MTDLIMMRVMIFFCTWYHNKTSLKQTSGTCTLHRFMVHDFRTEKCLTFPNINKLSNVETEIEVSTQTISDAPGVHHLKKF